MFGGVVLRCGGAVFVILNDRLQGIVLRGEEHTYNCW